VSSSHPFVEPVGFLLGEWAGSGEGLWSPGFSFSDHVVFTGDDEGGRPIVEMRQVTTGADGAPSHSEVGFLMCRPDGAVFATVAQPSGITEALAGRVSAPERLELSSVEIGHAPETDPVTATARRLYLEDGSLVLEVDISVGNEGLAPHTRSVLRRVG
jgi:hypothetical protein